MTRTNISFICDSHRFVYIKTAFRFNIRKRLDYTLAHCKPHRPFYPLHSS